MGNENLEESRRGRRVGWEDRENNGKGKQSERESEIEFYTFLGRYTVVLVGSSGDEGRLKDRRRRGGKREGGMVRESGDKRRWKRRTGGRGREGVRGRRSFLPLFVIRSD